MAIFRISKARDYKTIEICGLKIKIRRKDFAATFKPFRNLKPDTLLRKDGFSIMSNFSGTSGGSSALKYFIEALKKTEIPFECLDICGDTLPKFKNKITFSTNPYAKPWRYNNITATFWEFEDGMEHDQLYTFQDIKAIICFSDFNAKYFKKLMPVGTSVFYLPLIPDIQYDRIENTIDVRKKRGLPIDSFVCYFNFSYHSSLRRKNPQATIDAFAKAFPAKNDNALLVIKTIGSNNQHKNDLVVQLEEHISKSGVKEKIILINEDISDIENISLINACDVYISMHRGEGIGLGMLEAMRLSKPVIATNYGGNTDFVKEGHSFPVAYKMIPANITDTDAYFHVSICADPDSDIAATYIRKLYEDKNLRTEMGKKAKEFTDSYCSIEKYKTVLENILKQL